MNYEALLSDVKHILMGRESSFSDSLGFGFCYDKLRLMKQLLLFGSLESFPKRPGVCFPRFDNTPDFLGSQPEITKLLLWHGADINAKGRDGKTALMFAKHGHITEYLIDMKADLTIKDDANRTCLFYVKNKLKAQALINANINLDPELDSRGRTALSYVDTIEVASIFINAGMKVDLPTLHFKKFDGNSTLYNFLCKERQKQIWRQLPGPENWTGDEGGCFGVPTRCANFVLQYV